MKNGRMDIMKKRGLKKFAAGVTLLLALGLLAGCGGEKKEAGSKAQLNVGIVQLVEHSALDAANKGFVDGLAEKGFKENENVAIDRQNAQADQSNLQNIAHRFVNNKVDLICAIATPAAQVMIYQLWQPPLRITRRPSLLRRTKNRAVMLPVPAI